MGMDWITGVKQGSPRAIARTITRIEANPVAAQAVIRALHVETGRAHIVGITGPPGCGKSSLVNELAKLIRLQDKRVGIVAVDPTSPFTGGALLGDRVRMRDLSGDAGVFVRSMASRGSLGGLSRATSAAIRVLDAAGFDIVLVETVGAGQAEVDIATTAHTTVVLDAPGLGDDIQSIKAGILEIADILVVNKADQPGIKRTVKSLEMMLQLGLETASVMSPDATHDSHHSFAPLLGARRNEKNQTAGTRLNWMVPLLQTVAITGQGVNELVNRIDGHRQYLQASGQWEIREWLRSRDEIVGLLRDRFIAEMAATVPEEDRRQVITDVAERRIDPYTAAENLLAAAGYDPPVTDKTARSRSDRHT
jgi:LAO/AO transport system kinase